MRTESVWEEENVLEMDGEDGCMTNENVVSATELYT